MTTKMKVFILLLSLVSATVGQEGSLPPRILSNTTEILVEEDVDEQPYVLTCEGTDPLTWSYVGPEEQRVLQSNRTQATQPGYSYATKLEMDGHYHQGYYYCHYNDTLDISNSSSFDSVYVYLFAFIPTFADHREGRTFKVDEGDSVTLDCRPTSPNLTVSIYHNGTQLIKEGVLNEPRVGFTISNLTDANIGKYTCDIEGDQQIFTIIVMTKPRPPVMQMVPNSHAVLGYDIEISCTIIKRGSTDPVFHWNRPNSQAKVEERIDKFFEEIALYFVGFLRVQNVTMNDSGNYTCTVSMEDYTPTQATLPIEVQRTMASFINITVDHNTAISDEGDNATWRIEVNHFPPTLIRNLLNDTYGPVEKEKYHLQYFANGTHILKILEVNFFYFGNYILNLTTPDSSFSRQAELLLKVRRKPRVDITGVPDILKLNTRVEAKCIEIGYQLTDIQWSFQACPEGICEESSSNIQGRIDLETSPEIREYTLTSITQFNATELGNLLCQAGSAYEEMPIRISEIGATYIFEYERNEVFQRVERPETQIFVETDPFTITCGASKYDYANITLEATSTISNNDTEGNTVTVQDESTEYTFIKKIITENATKNHSARYICNAISRRNSTNKTSELTILVEDLHPVQLSQESIMKGKDYTITKIAKESFKFQCLAVGTGHISVSWTKDGEPLPKTFPFADDSQQVIDINDLNAEEHAGKYKCIASNRNGKYSVEGYLTLVVIEESLSTSSKIILGFVVTGIVVLLFVVFIMCLRISKDLKKRRETRRQVAFLFERGRPSELNPDCTADEQAELLPYDKKWEISRDRITLGQQLGAGAFGRVIKALVSDFEPGVASTTVALKMSKTQTDSSQIRALSLELKIMLHLGKHLNIVNLIGANTTRIGKGELWILVEYCRYGSLLSFLHKQRKSFINMIDPKTGILNFSNTQETIMSPLSPIPPTSPVHPMSSASSQGVFGKGNSESSGFTDLPEDCKTALMENTMPTDEAAENTGNSSSPNIFRFDIPPKGVNMVVNPSYQTVPIGPQETSRRKLSRKYSLIAVDAQGNHFMYEKSTVPGVTSSFTTVDLICWAWQVAEGMEYLTRRKVLHGDLAARNLLLAEHNVVKISDFGLSRDIYKKDIYVKKTEDLMPVKWMSIEAIRDRVFSVESDVWAFGVTLWELFTLGGSPYYGIPIDYNFLPSLEKGFRMEKPKYATDDIYQLLLKCWDAEPEARPGFRSLANTLSQMLMPETTQHYNDKNDYFKNSNDERFKSEPDYLEMLPAPDFKNLYKKDLFEAEGGVPGARSRSNLYLDMSAANSLPYREQHGTPPLQESDPNYLPMSSYRGSPTPSLEDSDLLPKEKDDVCTMMLDSSVKKRRPDDVDALYRSNDATCIIPSLVRDNEVNKNNTKINDNENTEQHGDKKESTLKDFELNLNEGNFINLPTHLPDSKDGNYTNLPCVLPANKDEDDVSLSSVQPDTGNYTNMPYVLPKSKDENYVNHSSVQTDKRNYINLSTFVPENKDENYANSLSVQPVVPSNVSSGKTESEISGLTTQPEEKHYVNLQNLGEDPEKVFLYDS